MFDSGRRQEERPHNGPPFPESIGLAEVASMVFQCLPADHEQVAAGAFDAPLHLVVDESLRMGDDRRDATLDGFFELRSPFRCYADVGNFIKS